MGFPQCHYLSNNEINKASCVSFYKNNDNKKYLNYRTVSLLHVLNTPIYSNKQCSNKQFLNKQYSKLRQNLPKFPLANFNISKLG
jgi:hypothetical protein